MVVINRRQRSALGGREQFSCNRADVFVWRTARMRHDAIRISHKCDLAESLSTHSTKPAKLTQCHRCHNEIATHHESEIVLNNK